jgi:hypothetical protein
MIVSPWDALLVGLFGALGVRFGLELYDWLRRGVLELLRAGRRKYPTDW